MLTILRELRIRFDDGEETSLCECEVETDTTNMRAGWTTHRNRYFRQAQGDMRALHAVEIEPGIFKLTDGRIGREVRGE